jgi:class 3 adenylate cyclase
MSANSSVISTSEALVIVDMVDSVRDADLFGWAAVGRPRTRILRESVDRVCPRYGLSFRKFTGDGYLMAFADPDHTLAVVHAVQAMVSLAQDIEKKNQQNKQEQRKQLIIKLRFAINFGEVDVIDTEKERDREGLAVSFVFRMEGKGKDFSDGQREGNSPTNNYAIVSERVQIILEEKKPSCELTFLGLYGLKGFIGSHKLFRLSDLSQRDPEELIQLLPSA